MTVHSSAFGGVTLTGDDAKKFNRQVTFGRPKADASASVARGVALAKGFRAGGRKLILTLPVR